MLRVVAKVAVSKAIYAIDKPYDYLVPEGLQDTLKPGMRVLVTFGSGNRGADGVVLSIAAQATPGPSLKMIQAQLDEEPVLDSHAIQLALWMRERYFCPVYDCLKAMLPGGLYFSLRDCITLAPDVERERAEAVGAEVPGGAQLIELLFLWDKKAELQQIRLALGARDPQPAIRYLSQQGIIQMDTSVRRGIGDKVEKLAVLAVPPEDAISMVTPRRKSAPLQYSLVELLCMQGAAGVKELCYLTGASMSTVKALEKKGVLSIECQEVFRRPPITQIEPAPPPVLNPEQQAAFLGLNRLRQKDEAAVGLLYGVTGSGKTQIYIRLIQEALAQNQTALVLVPEIALTPQLLGIFTAQFGGCIALLHSALGTGERYDEWKRVRGAQATVVLGTRSAVFAPLQNLGLIILDEEQEPSYKSENAPRYHARDVAKYRCKQHNALLVLGSATPSIESMHQAQSGAFHLFPLTKRYNQRAMPDVLIADMKQELRQGNQTAISTLLRREIEDNLCRGEQTILFLNRRGSHRMVSCGECGEVPGCVRCSVKLTYHAANGRLMCHYCGHSEPLPPACPACGGLLHFIGVGTQRVQEEVEALFPGLPVLRMDTDTVSITQPHDKLLARFVRENIPIMVGTQMVAKGLDFENVTLVGVIAPDLSLYIDDFRAGERTFSLLTQVVGRAGRGEKRGRAVIQTYTPEHEVIVSAARQDYDQFYQQEIQLRQLRGYPPFAELIVLTASGLDEGRVLKTCARLRRSLDEQLPKSGQWSILGPAPASVSKVNHRYRYRLTLTGHSTKDSRLLIAYLIRVAQQDKENRGISVYADINPYQS